MQWFYADQGRQIGPVEEAGLDDLVRAGLIRDDTLVWREGMGAWQAHGIVRGRISPAMPVTALADGGYCGECGRPFPANELVTIGLASICAACKPIFLQRIREGGLVTAKAYDVEALVDQYEALFREVTGPASVPDLPGS